MKTEHITVIAGLLFIGMDMYSRHARLAENKALLQQHKRMQEKSAKKIRQQNKEMQKMKDETATVKKKAGGGKLINAAIASVIGIPALFIGANIPGILPTVQLICSTFLQTPIP